jgi:YHS domain-containing protein
MVTHLVRDPVCGMEIDPTTAAATSEYKEETYYFCAPGCKADFDRDPEKYLDPNFVPEPMEEPKPRKRWWEFWK